jgi:hypothetical protein
MTEETEIKPNILLKRQEDQELRIYFFIGQRNVFDLNMIALGAPQVDKTIVYVLDFKLEDAFDKAKVKVANGYNLTFTGQKPTVREFLHEMELEAIALQIFKEQPVLKPAMPAEEKKEEVIPLTPRQISFEQFRSGVLFFANEDTVIFQNPEDRETLKRIIGTLEYALK